MLKSKRIYQISSHPRFVKKAGGHEHDSINAVAMSQRNVTDITERYNLLASKNAIELINELKALPDSSDHEQIEFYTERVKQILFYNIDQGREIWQHAMQISSEKHRRYADYHIDFLKNHNEELLTALDIDNTYNKIINHLILAGDLNESLTHKNPLNRHNNTSPLNLVKEFVKYAHKYLFDDIFIKQKSLLNDINMIKRDAHIFYAREAYKKALEQTDSDYSDARKYNYYELIITHLCFANADPSELIPNNLITSDEIQKCLDIIRRNEHLKMAQYKVKDIESLNIPINYASLYLAFDYIATNIKEANNSADANKQKDLQNMIPINQLMAVMHIQASNNALDSLHEINRNSYQDVYHIFEEILKNLKKSNEYSNNLSLDDQTDLHTENIRIITAAHKEIRKIYFTFFNLTKTPNYEIEGLNDILNKVSELKNHYTSNDYIAKTAQTKFGQDKSGINIPMRQLQ